MKETFVEEERFPAIIDENDSVLNGKRTPVRRKADLVAGIIFFIRRRIAIKKLSKAIVFNLVKEAVSVDNAVKRRLRHIMNKVAID